MTGLPHYVIPAIIGDQLVLRLYTGGDLVHEIPLRPRRAMTLAAQLLNQALIATANDRGVLEAPGQGRVANEPVHAPEGSDDR